MGAGGSVLFTDVGDFESRLPGNVRLVMVNGSRFVRGYLILSTLRLRVPWSRN